ncbi:MAG: hypothetical protein RL095_3334 [Verrucomicrobiota bacterium]|jgi:heme A synthase
MREFLLVAAFTAIVGLGISGSLYSHDPARQHLMSGLVGLISLAAYVAGFKIWGRADDRQRRRLTACLHSVLMLDLLLLVFMGAMTATTRSGMAFTTWPHANGLLWPSLDYWWHNHEYFFEHGHRLLGQLAGFLAILALVWAWRSRREEPRAFRVVVAIFLMICLQGLLGGLTVKMGTHWSTSLLHGLFAQMVMAAIAWMVLSATESWRRLRPLEEESAYLRWMSKWTCIILVIQSGLGAAYRHCSKVLLKDAEGRILVNAEGRTQYLEWNDGNTPLLFAHIGFAVFALTFVLMLGMSLRRHETPLLRHLSLALLFCTFAQVALGVVAVFTVIHRSDGVFNTHESLLTSGHVLNGGLLFVLAVLISTLLRRQAPRRNFFSPEAP